MFLSETWKVGIEMWNVGQYIAGFYDEYCRQANIQPDVVTTAGKRHHHIGALEKSHERKARIISEGAIELAKAMWREAGTPPGGYHQYVEAATASLRDSLDNGAKG
jgi:hypothetical protein